MKQKYEVFSLPNGMEVLLIPNENLYSVTISALTKWGCSLETKETQGISHFVEHVALTATEKWPDKYKLNELIEFNGATYNASTSKLRINYFINVPFNKLEFGIEFIYQALYKALFSEEIIEQERKIILDEISKSEDDISSRVWTFISNELSEKKTNFIYPIIGTSDTVKKFTQEELKEAYKKLHSPNKVLLCLAGNFKIDEAKKLVEKFFEQERAIDELQSPETDLISKSKTLRKNDKKTDLVITDLIFPVPGIMDISEEEDVIGDLVIKALSGPMSSRLNKRLREKENLLYSIGSYYHAHLTFGLLGITFEIPPQFQTKAQDIALEEIEKLIDSGLTADELTHYKEYSLNRDMIAYDRFNAIANEIRAKVFFGKKFWDIDKLQDFYSKLELEEVNKFIKQHLNMSDINKVAYGNVD